MVPTVLLPVLRVLHHPRGAVIVLRNAAMVREGVRKAVPTARRAMARLTGVTVRKDAAIAHRAMVHLMVRLTEVTVPTVAVMVHRPEAMAPTAEAVTAVHPDRRSTCGSLSSSRALMAAALMGADAPLLRATA